MARSRSSQDSEPAEAETSARRSSARASKPEPKRAPAKRAAATAGSAATAKKSAATAKSSKPAKPVKTGSKSRSKPAAKRVAPPSKSKLSAAKAAEAAAELGSAQVAATRSKPRTAAQRDAAFDTLVRSACLKAGTAAAISSLTRRVPLLGRLAPTLLGPLAETVALAQVQKALVRSVIELYEVELSDPEQRGVVLLATTTNIGAQQLSKRSMEAILKQFGDGLVRGIATRVLPVASILAEITAAVASTYTVGKRAQALCKLPGTGAGNLADLLRGLSGIDQARLLSWSGEAFRLALMPFKSALGLLWR